MIRRKWINWEKFWEFEDKKYIQKRIDKINSLEIFRTGESTEIMGDKYFELYEDMLNFSDKSDSLFDIFDSIFDNDSLLSYLTDTKKFRKLYRACVRMQERILKEMKIIDIENRKKAVDNLFK